MLRHTVNEIFSTPSPIVEDNVVNVLKSRRRKGTFPPHFGNSPRVVVAGLTHRVRRPSPFAVTYDPDSLNWKGSKW